MSNEKRIYPQQPAIVEAIWNGDLTTVQSEIASLRDVNAHILPSDNRSGKFWR